MNVAKCSSCGRVYVIVQVDEGAPGDSSSAEAVKVDMARKVYVSHFLTCLKVEGFAKGYRDGREDAIRAAR